MSTNQATEALLELYNVYEATAYSNLVVGIVFGAYIVLYGTSLYILLRNGGLLRSAPRLFMLIVTTAMFALGIIALALDTSLTYQQFTLDLSPTSGALWSPRRTNVVAATGATIICAIFIISDVVCAWRAAVLWNYDRRVVSILALFVLGTIAAACSLLGLRFAPFFSHHSDASARAVGDTFLSGHRALILFGPTLATNVLSTSLIGLQAWRNRHELMSHLSKCSVAIKVEKIFAMAVESGFAYCCIWLLYLISAFNVFPDPGFTVMDAVLPYISGLYPTVIVIFVVLRKSPSFTLTKRLAGMHVSDPPQLSRVEARVPLSIVYTQREEIHSDSDTTGLPSPSILEPKDFKDKPY